MLDEDWGTRILFIAVYIKFKQKRFKIVIKHAFMHL